MKNNKILIYIVLLAVGMLLGWLLFGGASKTETGHNHGAEAETNQMWTCSMHPQIMQPEPGDCPICGMDLIPAENSADGLLADQFKLTENAMALANIQTSVVGDNMASDDAIVLSGKITENLDETATQPAHFMGRIEKLYVTSLGEPVSKGQAIAQVYSPELVAAQQELITAYKLKESQPKLYQAVRNKFKNWMIHGSQLDAIEKTGKVKSSFTIYSHVSGVVTEIFVNEGAHILDGKPIFKVSNLSTVWANFDVYENQISQFKKGQKIAVKTNAYPDKTFNAKVDFIDPVLNTTTRTVSLRVVLNNKDAIFKPGMFVEGALEGGTLSKTQTLSIPASAVLWTGKRSVVYLNTNPKEAVFEMRQVTLGNKIGDYYQVLEGLTTGDEIVTNGTFTVDAAAQLQGKKSMMNSKLKTETPFSMTMDLPVDFQRDFEKIIQPYLKMKDAFVVSDADEVSNTAKPLLKALQNLDTLQLDSLVKHHLKKSRDVVENISKNNDLENQRAHFVTLNKNLIVILENVHNLSKTMYVQKCPMADNNQSALWISSEQAVLNPYFGKAMLTCGETIQTIK